MCLCGASDCVRCRGESARYDGWCDECEFADADEETGEVACNAAPGSRDCKMKAKADDAKAEAQIAAMEDRD